DRFTKSFSALLWLRHQLEAEHATRGRPRVFLSYEGMLDDWHAGIEAIANALKIDWPLPKTEWQAKLSNHFSETHQHHVASAYQLETAPAIDDWVKQTYAATRTLEKGADDGAAMLQLDAVREGFDSLNPLFADAFFSEMSARENSAAEHLLRQRGATDEFAMELEKTRLEAAAREIQLTQQLREVLHLADEQAADVDRQTTELEKVQEQYLQLMHQKEALRRLTEMQAADRDQDGLEAATREADLTAQANYEARRANDAERRIQDLIEESERLKVAISQIKSSPLWKATYPARYLKSLLKSDARGTGDA
ncbi:MAG: hypothetical protein ABJB10_12510, partial [Mesorhizobium sp.]